MIDETSLNIEFGTLNEQLREYFPILGQPRYTRLLEGIKAAGAYVVFGVVFNHYIVDLATTSDPQAKDRVASFIEAMAASHDERVVDLLKLELLPTILQSQTLVDAYWPALGVATRRALRLLPPRFARNVELPPSD